VETSTLPKPLTPDIVSFADAESDRKGREIYKTIEFTRPDGSLAEIPFTYDAQMWIDWIIKKRLERARKRLEIVLAELERVALEKVAA
jgi:hypothetical protein